MTREPELPSWEDALAADVRTYVPVTEVEAVQVTTANAAAVARWCDGRTFPAGAAQVFVEVEVGPGAGTRTLARDADWVVCHVDGEYEVLGDAEFQRRYRWSGRGTGEESQC